MYCPKCGTANDDNNLKCVKCGEIFHYAQQRDHSQIDRELTWIIPYTNPPALISYYLGLFSIIPMFGIILGIAAVILGLLGLRASRKNPEMRGKVHAWIGIIVGGLFGFVYLAVIVLILFLLIFSP